MGLVISPNLQTRAYGACERPPVSPDFRVPPTSKHLAPSLSITAAVTSSCCLVMGKSQSKSQAQVTIYVQCAKNVLNQLSINSKIMNQITIIIIL